MQITRATEYAIRGVLYLCSQPEGSVCLLSEISENQKIPPSFLSKIFQNLAKVGIVSSFRGTGGGFALIKNPSEITLLEVLEAIEGPISLNVCLIDGNSCENRPTCAVHPIWKDAQQYLTTLLGSRDFEKLVRAHRELADGASREPQPSD